MRRSRRRYRRRRGAVRVLRVILLLVFLTAGAYEVTRRFGSGEDLPAGSLYGSGREDGEREGEEDAVAGAEKALPALELPASLDGYLLVDFLDVGQGDCTLIRQGSHAMLFDCGGELPVRVRKYLRDEGIGELEMVWLSHADSDHIGSFPSVAYDVKIRQVYWNGEEKDTVSFSRMMQTVREQAIPSAVPAPGQEIALGDALVRVLGPLRYDPEKNNNNSLAVMVSYGDTRFLFSGDAEAPEEEDLVLSGAAVRADVLQAGHHGSNSSSTELFLQQVKPSVAVISCGAGNDYGHPGQSALRRLEKYAAVYRTDLSGTIRVLSDGRHLSAGGM